MLKDILFMNPNYVFRQKGTGKVSEGGLARNVAWESMLTSQPNTNEFRIGEKGNGLFAFFWTILHAKNKTLFFLYPSVGVSLFKDDIKKRIIRALFILALRYSARHNRLVFDVSDLKYEQARDLTLSDFNIHTIENVEKKIMTLDASYIFASGEMCKWACKKYNIPHDKTTVCANGSHVISHQGNAVTNDCVIFHDDVIYYVYAGTLNKGRNIEKMIEEFPDDPAYCMVLMGMNGEWILEKYGQRKNIVYVGALEQSKAHYIVSLCDVGLIPYDDEKTYYNIAYPTKLPFYIMAGIPVLSTPVREVQNILNQYEIGWAATLENWGERITHISSNDITTIKQKILTIQPNFTWENMLKDGIRMLNSFET